MTVAGRRTVGGLARDLLGIVASLSALIALPFVFGAVFLGLVSIGFLSGWSVRADPGRPTTLGFTAPADSPVLAWLPACQTEQAQILLLLDGDDNILWRAESAEPVLLSQFFVGMAPAGFTEAVPLAAALDPAGKYTVEIYPGPLEGFDALSDSDRRAELNSGGAGGFSPGELQSEELRVGSKTQSQEEFDSSCDD